jgi:DNA-binding response OmpR family regulator
VRAHLRARGTGLDRHHCGRLVVDGDARRAWIGDVELDLRAKELDLLLELARHAGSVVTREQLMRDVWDDPGIGSTKTLDVHMAALRRRLAEAADADAGSDAASVVEADGDRPVITTLRGVGFRLERG